MLDEALENGPITDIGRRTYLDPIQLSPIEKKILDDQYGHEPITTPGHGKQVVLTGSVAALLSYLENGRGLRVHFEAVRRKISSLAGFHASHDTNFTPKNSLHVFSNNGAVNQYLPGFLQPKENKIPHSRGTKHEKYTHKVRFRSGLYTVDTGIFSITYAIYNDRIVINNINYTEKRLYQMNIKERNGLYHVIEENGIWRIKAKASQIDTQFAAVNGQSNNLNKAAWLMAEHLGFRYGEERVKEFTLYHNRTYGGKIDTAQSIVNKFGLTTRTARQLCEVLENCQDRGHKVFWLGHSQGAIMLQEAVRWHLHGGARTELGGKIKRAIKPHARDQSPTATFGGGAGLAVESNPELANPENPSGQNTSPSRLSRGSLDVHTVALHGAATKRKTAERIFKEADIKLVADVAHPP